MNTTRDRLTFSGPAGEELAARLHRPAGEPIAYALFAHCFTCSKDLNAAVALADTLAASGIAVMRFDFTGLGDSEGDFARTNFTSNVQDLIAAANFLAVHHQAPALLVGHSLGGSAVLAAAGQLPSVRAVVTVGAPADPAHTLRFLQSGREEIERSGRAEVILAGRAFTITKQLIDDLQSHDLLDKVRALRVPLLVCHSPQDEVVDIGHAETLFRAANQPKSYLSLDQADHLISNKVDAAYAATVIAAWASKFVGGGPAAVAAKGAPAEGVVEVSLTGPGFASDVRVGHHYVRADEPLSVGGTDTGPAPYDFLLAALGTCTAMTLRMYADRKKLPLEGVRVVLRHQKVHARDCSDCETTDGKIDVIDRALFLEGPLDEAQRARLGEIADMCPVHRTLHAEIKVKTRVMG